MEVWVTCAIYKLAHGCNLLTCNEIFASGKSTMGLFVKEFIHVINFIFVY